MANSHAFPKKFGRDGNPPQAYASRRARQNGIWPFGGVSQRQYRDIINFGLKPKELIRKGEKR